MYAEKLFLKLLLSLLDSAAFKLSVRMEDDGMWGKSMPDICRHLGRRCKMSPSSNKKRLCSNIFNLHSVHSINAWRLWGPTLYYVYYPIRFFCVRLCNHFHTRVKDFTHCLIFYSDQCKTLDILLNSTVHIYCILQKW